MILSEIKSYLMQRREASLADIALHFDSHPDAVRGMLETWISKGKVARRLATNSCGSSCCQCDTATTEIYEWLGAGANRPAIVEKALPLPTFCKH